MGGVVDFIFGSDDDAEQTGTAETLTPGQRALLEQITGMVGGQLGQTVPGQEAYGFPQAFQYGMHHLTQGLGEGQQPQNATGLQALQQIMGGTQNIPQWGSPGGAGSVYTPPAGGTASGRTDTLSPGGGSEITLAQMLGGGSGPPPAGPTRQLTGTATGGGVPQSNMADFDPSGTMDWWESAVRDPMMQTWENDILPQVMEPFAAANAFDSGANRRAVARSGEDLATGMGGILANALSGERQAHLGRQFSAGQSDLARLFAGGESDMARMFGGGQNDLQRLMGVPGMAQGLEQQPFQNFMQMLGMGTSMAGTERAWGNEINQSAQPWNNPWLNLIQPALGVSAFSPIVQGPTQQQGLLQSAGVPLLSSALLGGFF